MTAPDTGLPPPSVTVTTGWMGRGAPPVAFPAGPPKARLAALLTVTLKAALTPVRPPPVAVRV